MSRILAAIATLALGLTAAAAPGPKEKGADLYYPTKVGDKLVYEERIGNVTTELTEIVTKVEKKNGALLVTTKQESSGGENALLRTASVTDEGVFVVASDESVARPPIPIIKARARPGDSWTWEPEDGSDKGVFPQMKCTMGKKEEVEVPAGRYWAVRIESEHFLASQTITSVCWYAPGVGRIKVVSQIGGTGRVLVLKSFTPGE